MTVHIHHRAERKYFAPNGDWVADLKKVRAFPNAREAAQYCRAENLKGTELLILRTTAPPLTVPIAI